MAFNLIDLGHYGETEELASQAVRIGQKILRPDRPVIFEFKRTHGMALLKLGRLEEAERLLLESYPILEALPGKRNEAAQAAEAIVEFYEARNAAEPGKGYDAKAAEWRAKLPADKDANRND